MREPVRFADAVGRVIDAGHSLFVEVGPHPVLAASLVQCLDARGREGPVLASLRRGDGERASMLRTLGALHVRGRRVDWNGVFPGRRRCVPLPTYPWQRERHWLAPELETSGGHPLLGRRLPSPRPSWEADLTDTRLGYLDGHVLHDRAVLPAAAYLEVALAAARSLRGAGPLALEAFDFSQLLATRDPGDRVLRCTVGAGDTVEVHSAANGGATAWALRATARLATAAAHVDTVDLADVQRRCPNSIDVDSFYAALAARHGLRYEGAFRSVVELSAGDGEALGRIAVADADRRPIDAYEAHPALLDAAFHVVAAASTSRAAEWGTPVPVSVERLELRAPLGDAFWSHATITQSDDATLRATVTLFDDEGRVLAHCEGLRLKRLEAPARARVDEWLYEERWVPSPRAACVPSAHEVVATAQTLLDRRAADVGFGAYYDAFEPALDALTTGYVRDALVELGYEPRHTQMPADAVAAALGVAPRHYRHFARLLHLSVAQPSTPPPRGHDGLADAGPEYRSAVELVRRSGERLAGTLRGEIDPREWMIAGEASALVAELYAANPGFVLYARAVADCVAAVHASRPSRPLRVLEVGAGTGGATGAVLDRLAGDRIDYLFTDV
ncbi:MAG: polyketide synthase dehydratase domain-containing protein, partial [Acidimicrobiales bacterium]